MKEHNEDQLINCMEAITSELMKICVDKDTPIGNYNFSVFKDF